MKTRAILFMTRFLDRLSRLLKFILTLLMAVMIVPVLLQILSRYLGVVPRYIWTEEAARFCFVWIIMIGAMIAVREGTHFDVDLMPAPKSSREAGISRLMIHLCMVVMAIVFAWYGAQFARFGLIQNSEMSGINMASIYISFPLAGAVWLLFLAEKIVQDVAMISENRSGGGE